MEHLDLASPEARRRFGHRQQRLARLEALRDDDGYFEAAFASDRHLKLCAVIDHASEMAEAAFVAKAVSLGLCVSKPWGESQRYDLIVDNGRRLLRVQVKSAHRSRPGGGAGHGQKARDPHPGQARRRQPHRGRRAGTAARPDLLTPHPRRLGSTFG